jgi:hypothetical protein
MSGASGRNLTWEYRRNRAAMLTAAQAAGWTVRCGVCGHGIADGAPPPMSCDHVISPARWVEIHGTLAGVDSMINLELVHGTLGSSGRVNRCTVCQALAVAAGLPLWRVRRIGACNQTKSSGRRRVRPQSRDWGI